MENLMLASTAIDLVAVGVLGWLVWRSGRERDAALGEQRAALESLRADLSQLVLEAEHRTKALDESLGAREQRLRALLRDLGSAESGRRAAAAEARRAEPSDDPDLGEAARRLGVDPAEARLLRDLQVSLAPRRA